MTDRKNTLDKKRHHYVSATYLRGFCDARGKVSAYCKDFPGKILYSKPEEIGFEKYYYSQLTVDGGQDNNSFEDLFGSVEEHWPRVLAAIKRGNADAEILHWFYAFLAMARARVPAARDFHESAMALRMRVEIKALAEIGKLPQKLRRYEHELDTVPIAVNRQRTLATMSDDMRRFGDMSRLLGFEVIANETDIDFITSDNPVCYFDPTLPARQIVPYDVERQIELYFPLDSRTLLRGSHRLRSRGQMPRVRSLTSASRAQAINRMIAKFGYRFLFARDRSHGETLEQSHAVSPVLSASVRRTAGEIEIHLRHVFGPRPALLKFRPDQCEDALTAADLAEFVGNGG